MDYTKYNNSPQQYQNIQATSTMNETTKFLLKVYNWMAIGLILTAGIAFGFAQVDGIMMYLMKNSYVVWGAIILEFVIVFGLTLAVKKIPPILAVIGFLFYASLTGVVFSILFLVYAKTTIYTTFIICSLMFGSVSALGYITKRDLSGVGTFMVMGLFGIIIASLVNVFIGSTVLHWMISYAGVLVFVGLTAWDTQKIKKIAETMDTNSEDGKKAAIFGAFNLYLDFINLFLFLLRILGDD